MSNLTSDAYDFGIESALSLFFKEAALPFAGKGVRATLRNIAAGGARPSVTAQRVLGGNLVAPPGSEGITKKLLNNPKPVPVPTGFGRTSTASVRTKQAWLDLAVGGTLGAIKASKSKAHPDETFEGGLRGAGGVLGGELVGGVAGGILGVAAGALLGQGAGPEAKMVGAVTGGTIGALGGGGYGAYRGYKALTQKYDK